MLVYATAADLQVWTPDPVPDDAPQLLRSATLVIARAVNENPYADGVTTSDPKRDATCAQVKAWLASGVRPGTAGLHTDPVLKGETMGGTHFEYDTATTAGTAQMRQAIADTLCPEAEAILLAAGVLWLPLPSFDGSSPGFVQADDWERFSAWNPCTDWWRL